MQTHGARKKRCRFFLRNKIQEQNISLHRCFRRSGRGLPGSDATFEASTEELCRPLRAAGEFPSEPARTLRLRRMRASVRSSTYYELLADLSDNTSIGKRSLKKACRFAFKP